MKVAALFLFAVCLAAQPIALHPSNPHYFLFQGRPTVLVTSAEHYGAVVNGDFDYVAYLDALQSYGLNYTRIYPGFLFEPAGKFVKGNTLGVRPRSLVLPWARSGEPGYMLGGNKFDLDRWDSAFFSRLGDFLAKAAERGIVVEICFFNAQYSDTWPISPLYYENNVQGAGRCDFEDAQTLRHADVVRRESDYVRKITEEVNGFDNVILEICDEPYLTGTPMDEAGKWIGHMLGVIRETESRLPKQHLVGQQVEGPENGPCDFSGNPGISVIVTQYLWESYMQQMGGLKALDAKYRQNKPIELNETNYYPIWYEGDKIADSRVEAWEFMVGGGAGFNHLNGLFTVENPAGKTPENQRILGALRSLRKFLESFEFVSMRPDRSFVTGGLPETAHARGMSQSGRQYALYIHHGSGGKGSAYKVIPSDHREDLTLRLPAGAYRIDWIDPETGSVLENRTLNHAGGGLKLATPRYAVDVALRILAVTSNAAAGKSR